MSGNVVGVGNTSVLVVVTMVVAIAVVAVFVAVVVLTGALVATLSGVVRDGGKRGPCVLALLEHPTTPRPTTPATPTTIREATRITLTSLPASRSAVLASLTVHHRRRRLPLAVWLPGLA